MDLDDRFCSGDITENRDTGRIAECMTCGVAVINLTRHNNWHDEEEEKAAKEIANG